MSDGCRTASSEVATKSEQDERRTFALEHINCDQAVTFLSQLELTEVSPVAEANAVSVAGSSVQLLRASLVVDLVDTEEYFVIENLGPVSTARVLPSNSEIAAALGDVTVGTFSKPPESDEKTPGIIDIQGDSVVAIFPARYRGRLLDLVAQAVARTEPSPASFPTEGSALNLAKNTSAILIDAEQSQPEPKTSTQDIARPEPHVVQVPEAVQPSGQRGPQLGQRIRPERSVPGHSTLTPEPGTKHAAAGTLLPVTADEGSAGTRKTLRLVLRPAEDIGRRRVIAPSGSVEFQNGDDTIDLALPKTMPLIQLLDLVGEYLDLDYLYDPATIGDQSVALMLRGGLQGKMRVKDLYALLETVLKSKGLAMIRGEDKLVTIIPAAQALDADPQLVDVTSKPVQAGDIVVTRVFELHHVGAASVTSMLKNMKLGVAVSTLEETQLLLVTCYAHRMTRIEQLVNMLDRPGRLRECRFRRLQYTAAPALADKIRTLAQELGGITVTMASSVGSTQPAKGADRGSVVGSAQPVYLDMDERTNRVVMIGHEERLELLEELVDVLDVVREDLRIPRAYDVKHMKAQEAMGKLQELEIISRTTVSAANPRAGASARPSPARAVVTREANLTEDPLVVALEATNRLLIRATRQQHIQIGEFLDYVDVAPEDLRTLEVYEIQHVDAEHVKGKLEELGVIGGGAVSSPRITETKPTNPAKAKSSLAGTAGATGLVEEPQVVVTESTNSLLVNATAEQHAQIDMIIDYVDSKMPEEEMPYRIYPLENSSPGHVADILEQLIGEPAEDTEDKIEPTSRKTEEKITIVPDPNTFSIVVHANKESQEWIESLTKDLDKRRPQVLIDVTLVEITRTDTFEYDLNIVASAQEAVIGNIGIEPIHRIDSLSRLEGSYNLLDAEGNPTGQTKAFYSDENVQALLTAIKLKNYGRVLAKPKILVDDGQQGEISTTDETTYVRETVQVPDQGSPITTRDFEAIEASIKLQITPHISEGDLLRLDVHLSREDFGSRPTAGAPPDKATSGVTTTVFVPDRNTVILGGLVKLNQSKGGSKVPILGDIPLLGALFRSVDNSDVEKKLYVFLKANIVRPYEEARLMDLQKISDKHREAFEESEAEFQKYENIPGIKPSTMQPERVLEEL
ncbi:MAG: secretin N-terminal domain-containing protein [Planctomycetota bacterium]